MGDTVYGAAVKPFLITTVRLIPGRKTIRLRLHFAKAIWRVMQRKGARTQKSCQTMFSLERVFRQGVFELRGCVCLCFDDVVDVEFAEEVTPLLRYDGVMQEVTMTMEPHGTGSCVRWMYDQPNIKHGNGSPSENESSVVCFVGSV